MYVWACACMCVYVRVCVCRVYGLGFSLLKGGRGEKGDTDRVQDRPVDNMPFYQQMHRHMLRYLSHTDISGLP